VSAVATDPERSLLAQTVLVLPRTMVVYDHGIQQQKRVERTITASAMARYAQMLTDGPSKTKAITRLLALSSPRRKFLLSRASTGLGGGSRPGRGREAATTLPQPGPLPRRRGEFSRLPRKRRSRDSVNDELAGVDRHLGAESKREGRRDDGPATGGGVPVSVASSSVRPTPARVRQRLRRDLSLGQSAPRALSSRTRCTSLLHSVRPHRRQATLLENDRGSSRQVPALRIPTGSPTILG
jgi:hypothetical protein